MEQWLLQGLTPPASHGEYLKARGVDGQTSVSFHGWSPPASPSPCAKYNSMFGALGTKIKDHLIIPVHSPQGVVLGFEARTYTLEGGKKVLQYRTDRASWNPYVLGAPQAFKKLWGGGDLWIVEGIFDLVAIEKVVAPCDGAISTLRAGMDGRSLDMIARLSSPSTTIYIAYDNDETGRSKAEIVRKAFLKRGCRAVVWKYRGKDPNEVWKEGGVPLLRRMFS